MKITMLIITSTVLLIGCTGGGGSNSQSPEPVPNPRPLPPPQHEPILGVQAPRQQSIEIESENFKMKLTNIGWCEAMGGILRPNPCHYHDYTKIEYDGKVGYLYRELVYDIEKPATIGDVTIEPTRTGMDALWEVSSAKWDSAEKEILPLAKSQYRVGAAKFAWKHATYLKAEQLKHRLATDSCRTLPVWKKLRELTPDKQGNMTITMPGLAYLDSAVAHFQTLLELGADGRPLSVGTEFQDFQSGHFEVKKTQDIEVSETFIDPKFTEGLAKPRTYLNTGDLRSMCKYGYAIKMKLPFFQKSYAPYDEFWPPYNEAFDDQVSGFLMRTNDAIFKRGYPITNIPRTFRYSMPLNPEIYLRNLPLVERIRPEHLEEYHRAYPQPFSEKDFE